MLQDIKFCQHYPRSAKDANQWKYTSEALKTYLKEWKEKILYIPIELLCSDNLGILRISLIFANTDDGLYTWKAQRCPA
jgi:hypothetical protein